MQKNCTPQSGLILINSIFFMYVKINNTLTKKNDYLCLCLGQVRKIQWSEYVRPFFEVARLL